MQNILALVIGEGYVLEDDCPLDMIKRYCRPLVPGFRLLIHHLKHPLRPGNRRQQRIPLVRQVIKGSRELAGVLHKGDDNPDRHNITDGQITADTCHNGKAQIVQPVHQLGNKA
ncbi:hypothetical protein D3C80_1606860 [compost metagenome]